MSGNKTEKGIIDETLREGVRTLFSNLENRNKARCPKCGGHAGVVGLDCIAETISCQCGICENNFSVPISPKEIEEKGCPNCSDEEYIAFNYSKDVWYCRNCMEILYPEEEKGKEMYYWQE